MADLISINETGFLLEKWEGNEFIFIEKNFQDRADTLDDLEFFTDSACGNADFTDDVTRLRNRALLLKNRLEAVDRKLFENLRKEIKEKIIRKTAFKDLVRTYINAKVPAGNEDGYDNLDLFINALFSPLPVPEPALDGRAEMVYYQKTPARIVFEMAEYFQTHTNDVFVDIGSGLGQVVLLTHLLTGITAYGIEFEPAYCAYAAACAQGLGLKGTQFINENALTSNLLPGTIFFLYTPFVGAMLQQSMERLQHVFAKKQIRCFTYGSCSGIVKLQSWLKLEKGDPQNPYSLCYFKSC